MKSPTKVELRQENDQYQLYLNESPFWINGAGLEFGDIEKLAIHGGNSFRTWRTENGKSTGKEVLDKALENGLFVTMGIDLGKERLGFDYNNEEAVAEQFERVKKEVLEYKDHPALIIWAIGNELNLFATNPKVWNAVNDISKFIHQVDTNHLTTTPVAGINKEIADQIKERAYDLDLLSIQMYADIANLPKYIKESGWNEAYMVTEWGTTGHWEVGKTAWDIPIEINSSVKADLFLERYSKYIKPYKKQCVGSYVFLWGQKQERTPTWYGMFLPTGEETETVDVMHYLWNKKWPENRCPRIESFTLDEKKANENIYLTSENTYKAEIITSDHDNDQLTFIWDVKPESTDLKVGGDFESTPESIPNLIQGEGEKISLTAPITPGAYRLFIYVYDNNGHGAHANIPFFVNDHKLSYNEE